MQLIVYFSGLCFLLHQRQNFLQLPLVAWLEYRQIVEDESGVAPECQRPTDIAYTPLMGGVRDASRYLQQVVYRRGSLKPQAYDNFRI